MGESITMQGKLQSCHFTLLDLTWSYRWSIDGIIVVLWILFLEFWTILYTRTLHSKDWKVSDLQEKLNFAFSETCISHSSIKESVQACEEILKSASY